MARHEVLQVVAPIPIWGRQALFPWTCHRLLNQGVTPLCIVERDKDRQLCEHYGFKVKQIKSKHLGYKWNVGFMWAQEFYPDAVLFVGSSDWVSDNWVDTLLPFIGEYDIVGGKDLYMYHRNYKADPLYRSLGAYDEYMYYWPGYSVDRVGESVGPGRLLSPNILHKMKWQPFINTMDKNMDYAMVKTCEAKKGKTLMYEGDIKVMALSTDLWSNMHQFDILAEKRITDVKEFLRNNFKEGLELWNVNGVYSQIGKQRS